jgi:preprotein translocase subunit YajC
MSLSNLFISEALAQTAAVPAAPAGISSLMNFVPLILIFAVFYFIVIRPQQKKFEETARMVKALQRGDRIITTGGICGKITKVEGDDYVMLEVADNVVIKLMKTQVAALEAKTQPANSNDEKKS